MSRRTTATHDHTPGLARTRAHPPAATGPVVPAPRPPRDDVVIRSLRTGEEDVVRAVLDQVSDDGRFRRFHTPTPRVTTSMVRALATVAEGLSGGLVALVDGTPVAHAQWTRSDRVSLQAEVAVVVADDHAGRGITRRLMTALAEICWCHGITELVCHVQHDNRRVREALGRRGARLDGSGRYVVGVAGLLPRTAPPGVTGSSHERRAHRPSGARLDG